MKPTQLKDSQRAVAPVQTLSHEHAIFLDERTRERDWLNPIAMSALQRAVKGRSERVVLNGTMFAITYGIMWHSNLLPDFECIRLDRVDGGLVPFGYISRKRIRNFTFEGNEK
jgi:hypothetical protein